ncbi:hypothetical protein CKO42_19835 [Lamprobacter modestohalophilus]|uniref:Acyltransferase n=1 Tax=Lamprobacter modestohalophilus TaxID=1064514 RepID=A0A9X1B5N7_9GAMM|nr:acyltransferase [Lamprobacter modestohalophilus]MBK1620638.1 hypothetical protein [Lamprobacter modestohalophilus]
MKYLEKFLKRKLNKDGSLYFCLSVVRSRPLAFITTCLYSSYYTKRLTGKLWPIVVRFRGKLVPLTISVKSANVVTEGNLIIESWQNGTAPISIALGRGSKFAIEGDFIIGQGVKIAVSDGATLSLGGRKHSTGSGITCDSIIMVRSRVEIGADVIISWGVFITDSDWHKINGAEDVLPVQIGDNVWISHDASILKGVKIGAGSIVGAKSLVIGSVPERCLVGGAPAKIIRENVSWSR